MPANPITLISNVFEGSGSYLGVNTDQQIQIEDNTFGPTVLELTKLLCFETNRKLECADHYRLDT